MKQEFFQAAADLQLSNTPFVVVTMISIRGHAPQDPGAKALVTDKGLYWGTVGGGKVEARAIGHAQSQLQQGKVLEPELITWNLQTDIGMTCGGEVTYLFEVHIPQSWKVAVFGAGHVGQALVRLLAMLPCQTYCIDERSEWTERLPQTPNLKIICTENPASEVAGLKDAYFVVMTQGHATDVPILQVIFEQHPNSPYVGVIGSDVKAQKIRKELKARGITDALLEKLHCPMGLPLGSNHPGEIAVSIAGQLLQIRDQGKDKK